MKIRIYIFLAYLGIMVIGCKKSEQPQINFILNHSFEESNSSFPIDWVDCGFQNSNVPEQIRNEIYENSDFITDRTAIDGDKFHVLIASDANTWESLSQQLQFELIQGESYKLEFSSVRIAVFLGYSINLEEEVNYASPLNLRFWAGNNNCEKEQLLFLHPLSINSRWLRNDFEFTASENFSHLTIEALHLDDNENFVNGNIAIDNLVLLPN